MTHLRVAFLWALFEVTAAHPADHSHHHHGHTQLEENWDHHHGKSDLNHIHGHLRKVLAEAHYEAHHHRDLSKHHHAHADQAHHQGHASKHHIHADKVHHHRDLSKHRAHADEAKKNEDDEDLAIPARGEPAVRCPSTTAACDRRWNLKANVKRESEWAYDFINRIDESNEKVIGQFIARFRKYLQTALPEGSMPPGSSLSRNCDSALSLLEKYGKGDIATGAGWKSRALSDSGKRAIGYFADSAVGWRPFSEAMADGKADVEYTKKDGTKAKIEGEATNCIWDMPSCTPDNKCSFSVKIDGINAEKGYPYGYRLYEGKISMFLSAKQAAQPVVGAKKDGFLWTNSKGRASGDAERWHLFSGTAATGDAKPWEANAGWKITEGEAVDPLPAGVTVDGKNKLAALDTAALLSSSADEATKGFLTWKASFKCKVAGLMNFGDEEAKYRDFFPTATIHGFGFHTRSVKAQNNPADRFLDFGIPWLGGVSGSVIENGGFAMLAGYYGQNLADFQTIIISALVLGGHHSLGELVLGAAFAEKAYHSYPRGNWKHLVGRKVQFLKTSNKFVKDETECAGDKCNARTGVILVKKDSKQEILNPALCKDLGGTLDCEVRTINDNDFTPEHINDNGLLIRTSRTKTPFGAVSGTTVTAHAEFCYFYTPPVKSVMDVINAPEGYSKPATSFEMYDTMIADFISRTSR